MRVCFVSEPLFPLSGTSLRTINFAKGLAERGHEVYIITPREAISSHRAIPSVHIRRLKAFMPQSFGRKRRNNFLKFLARGGFLQIKSKISKLNDLDKPTLIHYVNYYMSICGVVLERFIQTRSVHDLQASAVLESSNPIDKIFRTYVEKIGCSAANIVVPTDELRNYLVERYPSCKEKVHVVPLLINNNYFTQNPDGEARRRLGLSNNFRYLLVFHGSPYLENINALRRLKKVVESLNAKGLDTKVLVLGFIGKYVTSPFFIPCGYVENLSLYISAADLAVLPVSLRSLGMRTRLLECMSCGVPIVTLSKGISGYGEALKQEALVVAQTTDELVRLSSNLLLHSSLRRKISENALRYVRNYHSPRAVATKLESVYKDVLEK